MKKQMSGLIIFVFLGGFASARPTLHNTLDASSRSSSYDSLKHHRVFQVVRGRWQGVELNIYPESGERKLIPRDFRIGANTDGTKLIFESLIPNDNYIGYFSYYDEDCLQYDEYGFVQHLCLGPSGYVAWSGPCSAGSYRTRMTRKVQNGTEALVKSGDHWSHDGKLHRQNSGTFTKIGE
jgi:hypothetical protein